VPKYIKAIGAKTKRRIKKHWTEKDLFKRIWESRPHQCEICDKFILEARTWCFAHRKSKWVYPELRYEESNIALVCSIDCHNEVDRKRNKQKEG